METVGSNVNGGFVDILIERRLSSDVLWASRQWKAVRAYNLPHKNSPEKIKSLVVNSYRIRKILTQISKTKNVPLVLLYQTIDNILDEIGYKREVSILRWLGLFVSKLLKQLCSGVYVNETKFLAIRSNMGSNPILFVPSHRSYCDFILMSFICFTYDVDIPRIAAGMDFQSMAVMGTVLRDACAFFMRRSFTYDEIYSAVFSQYVQTLVTDGDAAIEFFIEGTRSRTAKSLMPKYGFLSMALKPFFTGLVPDITVIPVNLSYDRVLEEVLFAYELLGVPKPKESTIGFIKALGILKEDYGNMYAQFGDPFSIKEFFKDKIDRSVHGVGSVHTQDLTPEETKQVIHLAHAIVGKQKELTILNLFNVIAAILNDNFVEQREPLTVEELVLEVGWLTSVLETVAPTASVFLRSGNSKTDITHHLILHKSLVYLTPDHQVQLTRIHAENASVDPKKLKGHTLSGSTMDIAIPLLALQIYVNPCASFLVGMCLITVIICSNSSEPSIPLGQLFREFQLLCSIFSFEFVYHDDFIQKEFDKALNHSQHLKVVLMVDNNQVVKGDNKKLQSFCINFLSPFIPGYIAVAEFLLETSGIALSETEILKGSQKTVECKLKNGLVVHPANLSLDLIKNAVQAFTSMKLISKAKRENTIEYHVDKEKLERIAVKLKSYDSSRKYDSSYPKQFSVFIRNNL